MIRRVRQVRGPMTFSMHVGVFWGFVCDWFREVYGEGSEGENRDEDGDEK